MKYKILLDDFRTPRMVFNYIPNKIYNEDDWVVVHNYSEFVGVVEEIGIENISLISWDHDLAFEHYGDTEAYNTGVINYDKYNEKTGYHYVKWLCEKCLDDNVKLPECIYHTQNTIGIINMKMYVENFRKHCE